MSNTINWGKIHGLSYSPETNLTGTAATPSFTNTKSIELDGVDDFVDASSSISTISSDNEGTFSVWFKPNSLLSNHNIITLSDNNRTDRYLIFGWSSPSFLNNVFVQMRNGNSNTGFLLQTDTSPLTVGVWTHLALVQDGVSAKIYVNAVEVPQTFLIANNDQKWLNDFSINEFNIGKLVMSSGSFNFTDGNLDEFAYFSSALSSTDIETIYNSGVPNNLNDLSTPPIIWYRCGDGDTAPTLTDNGSGGNNATMENFSTFSTDVPT